MYHPNPAGHNARLIVTSPSEDPSPEPKERERGGFPPPTAAGAAGAKAEAGHPSRPFPVEPLTPCQRFAGLAKNASRGTQPKDRYQPVQPNNKRGDERLKLKTFKLLIRRGGREFIEELGSFALNLLDRRVDFH